MSLAHGGGALPLFNESTYNSLSGGDIPDIKPHIEEISDSTTRMILEQVLIVYMSTLLD